MRELKNKIRKPIDVDAKLFPRRLILDYVEDGQVAQHLARRSYVPKLGARSLQKTVHREIMQKLAHAFLGADTNIHNGMNQEPMAPYQVRLVSVGNNQQKVVLQQNGVKNVLQQREDKTWSS